MGIFQTEKKQIGTQTDQQIFDTVEKEKRRLSNYPVEEIFQETMADLEQLRELCENALDAEDEQEFEKCYALVTNNNDNIRDKHGIPSTEINNTIQPIKRYHVIDTEKQKRIYGSNQALVAQKIFNRLNELRQQDNELRQQDKKTTKTNNHEDQKHQDILDPLDASWFRLSFKSAKSAHNHEQVILKTLESFTTFRNSIILPPLFYRSHETEPIVLLKAQYNTNTKKYFAEIADAKQSNMAVFFFDTGAVIPVIALKSQQVEIAQRNILTNLYSDIGDIDSDTMLLHLSQS